MKMILCTPLATGAGAPPVAQGETCLVVLYEDAAACRHAIEAQECLAARQGSEDAMHMTWWRFDSLANPDIFEGALLAAEGAGVIVVAATGGGPLPAAVRVWLELAFCQRPGMHRTLVAVLGEGATADANGPVAGFLGDLAQAGRARFVTHRFSVAAKDPPEALAHIRERAEAVTPVLRGICEHTCHCPRW